MFSDGTVTLAPFERTDLPKVLSWINDPELCRAVDRVLPVTSLEHQSWYESLVKRNDAVAFAIGYDDETIGLCGLNGIHPRCRHADLWIYIGDAHYRGRALGRRAVYLLCRFGFEQLNLHRICLSVVDGNEMAIRSYLTCGFREEGRAREHTYIDGAYRDIVCMGLLCHELTDGHSGRQGQTVSRATAVTKPADEVCLQGVE